MRCHRSQDMHLSVPLRQPRPRRHEAAAKGERHGAPGSQARNKTSCHRCWGDNGCHRCHNRGKVCHAFKDRHGLRHIGRLGCARELPDAGGIRTRDCAAAPDLLDFKSLQMGSTWVYVAAWRRSHRPLYSASLNTPRRGVGGGVRSTGGRTECVLREDSTVPRHPRLPDSTLCSSLL